jgi:hypothetical protein
MFAPGKKSEIGGRTSEASVLTLPTGPSATLM